MITALPYAVSVSGAARVRRAAGAAPGTLLIQFALWRPCR